MIPTALPKQAISFSTHLQDKNSYGKKKEIPVS